VRLNLFLCGDTQADEIRSYLFHMVIYNSRKHADGLLPILHSNSFCYEYIYLVNVHIFNVCIFLSPISSLPRPTLVAVSFGFTTL